MKKKYLIPELIIILFFFVLPSFLLKGNTPVYSFGISFQTIILFIISILLNIQFSYFSKKEAVEKSNENSQGNNLHDNPDVIRFKKIITFLKWFALTLGGIMLVYAFTLLLSFFTPLKGKNISITLPQGIQWAGAFLQLMTGAFSEEVIYREFLPESLNQIFYKNNKKRKLIWTIILEAFGIIFFAAGHLYAGYISVINAFFSGIIFRICYKKTGNVYTGFAAHFVYNLLMLLFAFFSH